jgi:hypothetical protein
MKAASLKQDFWPGYLDVMVNVMLYLLLLVASFALGLVALTLHSMQQQQQLFVLGAGSLPTAQGMGMDEQERARVFARLDSLNIQEMVRRREALENQRRLREASPPLPQKDLRLAVRPPEVVQPAVLPPAPARKPAPRVALEMPSTAADGINDVQTRLKSVEDEYQLIQTVLDRENRQLSQLKARTQLPAQPVVQDFQVMVKSLVDPSRSADEAYVRFLQKSPKAIWAFPAEQFIWAADAALPEGVAQADRAPVWLLVIYADLENSRITRESFARIISVRETLVRQGFVRESIKVEVRSVDKGGLRDERLFRTVFMLQGS